MINCTVDTYSSFGKCLKISNGHISVYVTLDIGPRIIYYGLNGYENMLLEDRDKSFSVDGGAFDGRYYPGARWYLYGGHRLCLAPESVPETYYPDNRRVEYRAAGNRFEFLTAEPENGVEKKLSLYAAENSPEIEVIHEVKNSSSVSKTLSIWPVTAMAPGGTACAVYGKDGGAPGIPDRSICFWPATDIQDKRLKIGNRLIILRHNKLAGGAVKLGFVSGSGVCGYFVNGCLFRKKAVFAEGRHLLDMGAMLELYSGGHCVELESLSPTYTLGPGETRSHTELWTVTRHEGFSADYDEAAVIRLLESPESYGERT